MQAIIETLVYLLAVMGIILTITTFFEMFCCKGICTYRILNKNIMKRKRVEMTLHIKNLNIEEEEEIVKKIENGNYEKIEDIIDSIKIEKE